MDDTNPELDLARAFVEETNCTVFLTGRSGTGKTTFLHRVRKQTEKRLVVTAPTGVAAINAGGVTLHSLFQLPFGPIIPGMELHSGQHRISREKRNLLNSLDLLVIDEISMVRADLLDGVDAVLRRYRRSSLPFGGVQLLLIGDLHQLAPVVKEAEWQLLRAHYASPYFFSSQALRQIDVVAIELKRIYRQSEPHFIELLNQVRDNRLNATGLETLNSRYAPEFSPDATEGCITLCTHNHSADAINEAKMAALPGPERSFTAEVEGSFPALAYPTSAHLALKKGAQVMFVRNDSSPDKRYFNGKIGTIVRLGTSTVVVECPDDNSAIEVSPVTWENIEYAVDADTAEVSTKVIGSFSQMPLKPAWAITIHKSQGLTFDWVIIDAQAAFAPGQIYVALSRCRSFEGLMLSTPLAAKAIRTDSAVLDFVAAITRQAPTAATLQVAKIRFQQQLLDACYDFQTLARLLGRLVALIHGNASIVQVHGGADLFDVQQKAQEAICAVGDNFRRQLQTLFQADREPASDPTVRERLAKAATYFREQFEIILKPCVDDLEVESDNKEVRKRITDLIKQVRQECAAKLAAVLACGEDFSPGRYLRALSAALLEAEQRPVKSTSIYTEADVGHPELFRQLRHWRAERAKAASIAPFQVVHQKTLIQIAVHLPDSLKNLKGIKGIGTRLAEKYGEEIVALVRAYRNEHNIETVTLPLPHSIDPTGERKKAGKKEDTKKTSLDMLRDGLAIAEIARQRGLTPQTVEGHLAYFIKAGELAIDGLLPEERLRDLENKLATLQIGSLKAVKEALGDDYSYGEINLVLAHLQHRECS